MTDRVTPELKKDLLERLVRMRELSNMYYAGAQQVGIHTFIEHTGFINEHLKILERALIRDDIDIAMLNNHGSSTVHVESYEAAYLAEKFACMFAPILKDQAAWKAFVKKAEEEGCGEEP